MGGDQSLLFKQMGLELKKKIRNKKITFGLSVAFPILPSLHAILLSEHSSHYYLFAQRELTPDISMCSTVYPRTYNTVIFRIDGMVLNETPRIDRASVQSSSINHTVLYSAFW